MKGKVLSKRESWSGRTSFIFAAAASAVGLGNFWRFPYLTSRFGGGTFLLTFVVLVFTVGVALLILEIALGRKTKMSCIEAFAYFGKKYRILGIICSFTPFVISSYYCVVGGWVIKYLWAYIWESPQVIGQAEYFNTFTSNPIESLIFVLIFLITAVVVVGLGVKKGIERANNTLMPALIILSVFLAVWTAFQPGAIDGIIYFLTPDFSKFDFDLLVAAISQSFFALSLGISIMITYGSYLDKKTPIIRSTRIISSIGVIVSILAGFCIVPAAFMAFGSGEAVANNAGPGLMFVTLPGVFLKLRFLAKPMGILFFLLVLFAALTSIISTFEACVSILMDSLKLPRKVSVAIFVPVFILLSVFVNLGYNVLSFIEPLGPGTAILDLADFINSAVLLPLVGIILCIFVGWIIKPKAIIDEVLLSDKFTIRKVWVFVIKFVAPIFLILMMLSNFW